MAVDQFLKIDSIDGESQDSKHPKDIDVLAWSWGMANHASFSAGGGGGSGKVAVQDISITKYVDASTTNLLKAACTGEHFKKAVLVVRKAGKEQLEYLKITFEGVMISSVSTGGSGGEDKLTENVSLAFQKFKVEYNPQGADGKGTGAKFAGYSITENKVV